MKTLPFSPASKVYLANYKCLGGTEETNDYGCVNQACNSYTNAS